MSDDSEDQFIINLTPPPTPPLLKKLRKIQEKANAEHARLQEETTIKIYRRFEKELTRLRESNASMEKELSGKDAEIEGLKDALEVSRSEYARLKVSLLNLAHGGGVAMDIEQYRDMTANPKNQRISHPRSDLKAAAISHQSSSSQPAPGVVHSKHSEDQVVQVVKTKDECENDVVIL